MMRVFVAGSIAMMLLTSTVSAAPGERDKLNACKTLIDRAAQSPYGAELQKCRQIIKEWTLRDSRMSVDEQGRPLR